MILAIIMSVGMLAAIWFGFLQRRKLRLIGEALMVAAIVTILALWAPHFAFSRDWLDQIAMAIGAESGPALSLWCFGTTLLLLLLGFHGRLRVIERQNAILARHIALQNAEIAHHQDRAAT